MLDAKLWGGGIRSLKNAASETLGVEFETGIVWDGGTDTSSSRSSTCAAEWKLEQSLHSPEGQHLMASLYWLAAERATETCNSYIPKTPGASPFLWKNFWFFEFLKANFYKQIFRISLPNRGIEWEQMWYGWVWCWKNISWWVKSNSGGKLRWGTGRAALSISCGGVKQASRSAEWKGASVSTFLLSQKGREGHRSEMTFLRL